MPTAWHVDGTGDFNGDGRDDILWRHNSGTLTNWLGTANGSFADNCSVFATSLADRAGRSRALATSMATAATTCCCGTTAAR